MVRTTSKRLTCPACQVVVADAVHQRWPADLRLRAPDGTRIAPTRVSILLELARREQATAAALPDREAAAARVAFLTRHASELVYELVCPQGHLTLCTMPQLVTAVRRTPGAWVTLPYGGR